VSAFDTPRRLEKRYRFFPPAFFFPPFAVFFAIIPPWNQAAQLVADDPWLQQVG
jgi:hypothetical protein